MDEVSQTSSDVVRDPETWLAQNAAVVSLVARRVASHRGLRPQASAALEADLLARLIEDDHRVLRQFGGGAAIRTYLAVVTARLLLGQRAGVSAEPGRPG
jgi:hypothetical protein